MSKKDKKGCSATDDLQVVIAMIPKLEKLITAHKEIAEHYQMYRQNGGEEIPGIEKHLTCKEPACNTCDKTKKTEKPEAQKAKPKKTKKKDK